MELTQRQRTIFKTIVEQFTRLAEPIGSKTLMSLLDFPVSSATIRNEMAVLEKEGLLEKTHTSSGRIPSKKGYRYYVEHLMDTRLEPEIKNSLAQVFNQRHCSLEEIVETSCSILSEMTHLTSVVLGPDNSSQRLQHVQLIPVTETEAVAVIVTSTGHTEHRIFKFEESVSLQDLKNCTELLNEQLHGIPIEKVVDEMKKIEPLMAARLVRHEVLFEAFVSAFMRFATKDPTVYGRANMLAQPEFTDIGKLQQLMQVLENSSLFKAWYTASDNVAVPIGKGNELIQIGDCSVISRKFHTPDDQEGQLMVIGPNRMPYGRVVALMDSVSDIIEGVFECQDQGGSQ